MTWLFAHIWIIILAAIYLAWCAYCIWDGIMWHKLCKKALHEKSLMQFHQTWWDPRNYDSWGYGYQYGEWFSCWLILHVFGLFVASIVLFFRIYC